MEMSSQLQAIMSKINEKYYAECTNKKGKVIINCLRIGHTRLTNFLTTICWHCNVTDLNQLFKTVSSKKIIDFVKDIDLYNTL